MTSNTNKPADPDMSQLTKRLPKQLFETFGCLLGITDAFCDSHLNDEYKQLCRRMVFELCQTDLPLTKGKPLCWAAGVVNAVGWVNFLYDKSQSPHISAAQLASLFEVSQATIAAKAKAIREALDLMPFDPDWTLTSKLADNPLVWMVELNNGMVIDIRHAPHELQEEALEMGLIPFLPPQEP